MNVLYISHEKDLGGATLALLELIDEMILKDINVYVIIPDDSGDFYAELKTRKVTIIKFPYFYYMYIGKNLSSKIKSLIKSFINIITAIRITYEIKQYQIDIIHTNTSVINLGLLINKFTNIPHIFHIREFAECGSRKYILPQKFTLKFIDRYSTKIIVISRALYKEYSIYFNQSKLNLVYDGISKEYENAKECTLFKRELNILIVGDICMNKGQKDAVLAVDYLLKSGYKNVKLILVGNASTNYLYEIMKIIKVNKLENYIEYLGYRKKLNDLRKVANIEINCSRSEGFGRTTLEAMLSMNPIIGADTTATAELIINNFNGFLYKPGDYVSLAEKIRYFIEIPEEIHRMGANGYNYAIENFSARKNSEEIFDIYNEL